MPAFLKIYNVYVKHRYTVIIPQRSGNRNAKRPISNKVKGLLSNKSKKKIYDILLGWNEVIRCAPVEAKKKWKVKPRFTMLTLTLSSKQAHSDEEIKTKCLNPFITEMKKTLGFNLLYLWSAEVQPSTQNIHFHIVTDRYLDKHWVRSVWNRMQDRLGYVARCVISNPPSTDIRIRNIDRQSVAYLMKYLTKKNKKGEEVRDVSGKLWGCSHKLLCVNVAVVSEAVGMDLVEIEREANRLGLKIICPNEHIIFIPHNDKERIALYGVTYETMLEESAMREYIKLAPLIESYQFIKFEAG
jgi:hypothetical protein